jgi:ubiquinone/menaquinone biosynthesis C-methylase UbiE
MHGRTSHSTYLPGCGWHWLLPLYDPVQRLAGVGGLHDELIDRAELRAGLRVLDVGCGTGNLLIALGRRHPNLQLAGLDPDPAALRRARRKAARAQVGGSFEVGFAQQLPQADSSVDRLFSTLMFHHLDTDGQAELLAEVRRVLRPDGLLLFADLDGGHGRPGFRWHRRRHAHPHATAADVGATMAAAGLRPDPPVAHPLRFGGVSIIRAAVVDVPG